MDKEAKPRYRMRYIRTGFEFVNIAKTPIIFITRNSKAGQAIFAFIKI